MAVSGRAHAGLSRDIGEIAGAIVEHDRLAEARRQPLSDLVSGAMNLSSGAEAELESQWWGRIGWRRVAAQQKRRQAKKKREKPWRPALRGSHIHHLC